MPVIRGVELHISTTADTAGAKQVVASVNELKLGTLEMAKAQGASKAVLDQVSEAYDQLAKKVVALKVAEESGVMTNEEAVIGLNKALKETDEQINKVQQGFEKTGKHVKETGNQFRISAERGVMMGNAMAGLVTQFALGADGAQMMASGLTNAAMIMSSAGPWGIAAGFALQTITALGLKFKKGADEAAKEAAARTAAMQATVLEIQNARAAEQGYEAQVKATTIAVEAKLNALQRLHQEQKEERDRAVKLQALADQLEEQEREAGLADGSIDPQRAADDRITKEANDLFDEQMRREAEIAAAKEKAEADKASAQAEMQANDKAAAETEKRADIAREVLKAKAAAEKAERVAKETEDAIVRQATVDGAPLFPDDIAAIERAKEQSKAASLRRNEAQKRLLNEDRKTPFTRGKDRLIDTGAAMTEAEEARKRAQEARPGLIERDRGADTAINKAEREQAALDEEMRMRRDHRRNEIERTAPENLRHWDNMNERAGDDAAQSNYEAEIREAANAMQQSAGGDGAAAARGLTEMSSIYTQITKVMVDAVKRAQADAKKALKEVQDLRAQTKATN